MVTQSEDSASQGAAAPHGLRSLVERYALAAAIGGSVPSVLLILELTSALKRELPRDCNTFLDAVYWLDADAIYPHLSCMGENGRAMHLGMYKLDLVLFPMIYGTILFCAIASLLPRAKLLRYTAVGTVFFDIVENSSTIFLLTHFPTHYERVERCVSVGNRGKYVGLIGSTLLIVVGVLMRTRSFLLGDRPGTTSRGEKKRL